MTGPYCICNSKPLFSNFYFLKTKMDASVNSKNILHNKCIPSLQYPFCNKKAGISIQKNFFEPKPLEFREIRRRPRSRYSIMCLVIAQQMTTILIANSKIFLGPLAIWKKIIIPFVWRLRSF